MLGIAGTWTPEVDDGRGAKKATKVHASGQTQRVVLVRTAALSARGGSVDGSRSWLLSSIATSGQ